MQNHSSKNMKQCKHNSELAPVVLKLVVSVVQLDLAISMYSESRWWLGVKTNPIKLSHWQQNR